MGGGCYECYPGVIYTKLLKVRGRRKILVPRPGLSARYVLNFGPKPGMQEGHPRSGRKPAGSTEKATNSLALASSAT